MPQQMYRLIDKDRDIKFEKKVLSNLKDPEDRIYLICLRIIGGNDIWELSEGRTETYQFIKDTLETQDVLFDESFVLVENCTLADRKTIYEFLKHVQDFYNDGFDIDEYLEDNTIEFNNTILDPEIVKRDINIPSTVTMTDFMGDTLTIVPLE